MDIVDVALGVAALAAITAVVSFLRARRTIATNAQLLAEVGVLREEHLATRARYGPVLDLDAELSKRSGEVAAQVEKRDQLASRYGHDYDTWQRLKAEVGLLEENLEDMSFGVYKPHYDFDASEKYREALEEVWKRNKEMVRSGTAAVCDTTWTVAGSEKEGARMTKQNMKVMLRAFNGETDAAVAKVRWNNITRMEERIRKAYEAINDLGTANRIRITPEYLELALAELRLTYEYEKKKQDEKEQQREIRERMKEEERAQREFERAQQEAATEEERYARALAKARAEVEKATGQQLVVANTKVQELEARLAEAQAKLERAKSMAEQTRCGYIYIISNIGSFGEGVFKIGMTRRLDPEDRIRELGDASVPFPFDVHAMIYSEDAPTLEREFHRRFEDKSINLVNLRKEYFRIPLNELEAFATEKGVSIEFAALAEAQEFRETLALREQAAKAAQQGTGGQATPSSFPEILSD